MIQTNIAEFKSHLSAYLQKVEAGESIEICKRNIPVARVLPFPAAAENNTLLGCGRNTVRIAGDLTEPAIEQANWDMLGTEK